MSAPVEFGSYRILEQLGVGGMASVHIAESRLLHKRVALKRLLPHVAENPDLVKMFIHEATLARYLQQPNIARTLDFGKVGDTYFMAMELVPGPNLTQLVRQCHAAAGPIPLPVTLHVLLQMCEALDYAHNLRDEHGQPLGLIHRDISPPNIVISNTGTAKLIDFGIAKAARSSIQTEAGTVKGKFSYIAPEYLNGQLDHRVDLWSLGVVAWELLTMRRLFNCDDDFEVLRRVQALAVEPPSRHVPEIPAELDAIVMTALERDPAKRWQTAGAMRTALRGMIRDYGVAITDRRVLQWVEWAFTREPVRVDSSEVSELIALLEQPSTIKPSGAKGSGKKRPKLPTPVVGAAMVKRRRRGRALVWLLVLLVLAGAGVATWQLGYLNSWLRTL